MSARALFKLLGVVTAGCAACLLPVMSVHGATMNDYCVRPPFISQPVPPMVMFEIGRDHKLYYEAYNDGVDLDGDGRIDRTYDHSIEYYGYFNPYKCYTHSGGSGSNDLYTPVATNTDRFCSSGQISGNLLNWITMSRMDVLRKVMYGGQRSQESPKNVLNRAYIPQDAHSWGKEYTGRLCYNSTTGAYKTQCLTNADCDSGYACTDKSINLLGSAAPTAGAPCTTATISWGGNNQPGKDKMLVVRYPSSGSYGSDHADIMASIDTTQFKSGFNPVFVTNFDDAALNPATDHCDDCATVVVAEFYVGNSENGGWQFAIDGDDGVEMEVRNIANNNIVQTTSGADQISYYGSHAQCSCQTHSGTINLAQKTWYRLIVRGLESNGGDGVKVWFKKPGAASWTVFGDRTTSPTLDVRAPNIVVGTNDCTLKSEDFITNGVPKADAGAAAPGRHLICNTTLASGEPTSSPQATTLVRIIPNSTKRIWEWASKESPVCGDTFSDGTSAVTNRTDYTMQVEVCKSGVGTLSEDNKFERCRLYGTTYRPIGLFQKYGEYKTDGTGVTKVCSKTMGKPCGNDSDCGSGEGLCFDKADMYFGFMTTSYTKNLSGGVLRKNPGPVSDEVNMNNGGLQTSESDKGNLIISMDRMKLIDYSYTNRSYSNCGWITTRGINEGECKMWGNPIAEMMYESLRYFAGKGTPTAEFTYSTPADSGVNLSKPAWGYNKGSTWYQPYDIFPSCAQPFLLVLSDVNTSYDSDQIPGSSYAKPDGSFFTEDAASPQLGLGVQSGGKSLLNQLLETISATEGVDGNNWFIGESNGSTDFICSAKSVGNLTLVRGTCPEEPTKKGSYYAAAVAYYGKSKFTEKTGKPAVNTFVIALSSPFADIKIKAGGKYINVVPVGKSVSGSYSIKENCWDKCTASIGADGLTLSSCQPTAYCPTNALVDFYIDDLKYDTSNDIIYAKFRINFEDVEQGADHDMDAIATYEICTQAAADAGHGSCGGTINGVQVKVNSDYAAGSIDQVLGYVISGTTADGTYLVVKDKDVGSTSPISGLPLTSVKDFSVSATPAAGYLKNPLWYAAKWGGYTGSGVPDTAAKWDKDGDGLPDNYFPVSNPLELDSQLEKALNEILARVASGTAASILNNSEGSGANLLQAVFYPKKQFDNNTEVGWIGEMQNLWYYIDPFLNKTSIREDTVQDNVLNLQQDYVTQFYFDPAQSKTLVRRFSDANGDGLADSATPVDTISPDDVKSLWKAGRLLWERNLTTAPRTIFTGYGSTAGTTPQKFSNLEVDGYFNTWPGVWAAMQTGDEATTTKVISYVHGTDQAGFRDRKVTISGCGLTDAAGCTREWKLGDIVSSTPKLVSNVKLNTYDLAPPNGYNDASYLAFSKTPTYQNRGMALVGGNDGMLHAFKLGVLHERTDHYSKAQMNDETGNLANAADQLGKELWSFIPKNALPYLRYLTCKKGGGDATYCANLDYDHIFLVDRTPTIVDASIMIPADTTKCTVATDYSTCEKLADGSTWSTILIGGMGYGGASRTSADGCTAGSAGTCIKAPITNYGLSSYFALDVKDPVNPKYLWEFEGNPAAGHYLGAAITGPAIVRVGTKKADGVTPDHARNGKWFAVFASGPTGPIDTTKHQFLGTSNQNLKLFILDLKTGTLLRTIDTGIANAFAGTLSSAVIDTDRSKSGDNGYYSDDAVYIGYTAKNTAVAPNTWTKGGILRLVTKDNPDPAQWTVSTVINDIGPVTTTVTKLQDRPNKTLWLYFGTGRYFYKNDDPALSVQQRLYGIKEPCYSTANRADHTPQANVAGGTDNDIAPTCTDAVSGTIVNQSGDASTAPADTLSATAPGWYINLDAADSATLAERVITDPVALPNGNVFFTTFKPSSDICKFGGDTLIWALRYNTGGVPPARTMQGTALMQVSTGAFAEVKLATAFSNPGNLRLQGRRLATPIQGVPPTAQGLSLITNPKPVKKYLHIREK
ncbi:pilus assembly protein [Trichlorobacter ammonificans]|uniref:Type IV pilus assembly protein PilY1 n=1 Tax=Trichlorobacter ammonificans TaxID=2916410 RepID=A0ABM9D6R3_9BACT|nr:pilus assembly protein PilY [Trichlorobacter ammonificans]CAH2030122.1 Type IV pilus assembly protein PilY1 [Trichlorobacter ammonificans]